MTFFYIAQWICNRVDTFVWKELKVLDVYSCNETRSVTANVWEEYVIVCFRRADDVLIRMYLHFHTGFSELWYTVDGFRRDDGLLSFGSPYMRKILQCAWFPVSTTNKIVIDNPRTACCLQIQQLTENETIVDVPSSKSQIECEVWGSQCGGDVCCCRQGCDVKHPCRYLPTFLTSIGL